MNNADKDDGLLVELTADIVTAYVSNNSVSVSSLPELIRDIHSAFAKLDSSEEPASSPAAQTPAVAVRKSVTPDHIMCLEDGKKFRSIKRHLATSHGLTPDAYREKWGLRPDYPMVAPNYAAQRSELAKSIGLGRKQPAAGGRGKAAGRRVAAKP